MNMQLALSSGRFAPENLHLAPKRIAFSTKMHCKMRQNADQYAAKRKDKGNNMHNVMQQNTASIGI